MAVKCSTLCILSEREAYLTPKYVRHDHIGLSTQTQSEANSDVSIQNNNPESEDVSNYPEINIYLRLTIKKTFLKKSKRIIMSYLANTKDLLRKSEKKIPKGFGQKLAEMS